MGDLYAWIEREQLKRLSLPTIATGERGYAALPMSKTLQLVWPVVNQPQTVARAAIRAAAAGGGSAGATFPVPSSRRYYLLSLYVIYTCSSTVGTRSIQAQTEDQATDALDLLEYNKSKTTTQVYRLYLSGIQNLGTALSVLDTTYALNFPIVLEAGWQFHIWDSANIDAADTVAWNIKYLDEEAGAPIPKAIP